MSCGLCLFLSHSFTVVFHIMGIYTLAVTRNSDNTSKGVCISNIGYVTDLSRVRARKLHMAANDNEACGRYDTVIRIYLMPHRTSEWNLMVKNIFVRTIARFRCISAINLLDNSLDAYFETRISSEFPRASSREIVRF